MTRLDVLKKELEIARNMKCLSFDNKEKVIAWYEHEIECIEKYNAPNPKV